MKKLSPEATSILDAARHVDDPTPDDKARVKRAVMAAVATSGVAVVSATAASKAAASAAGAASASIAPAATVGAAGVGAGAAAGAGATAVGVTGLGVVTAKALATLTIVGASVGVAVTRPWEPSPEPSEPAQVAVMEPATPAETSENPLVDTRLAEPMAENPMAENPVAETPLAESLEEAPVEPEPIVEAPRPRRIAIPSAAQSGTDEAEPVEPDTLAAELAVLRQARLALGANDFAGALRALDDHAARFPRGALVAERNGTRALVLCRSGNPAGVSAAQRFLSAHPRSPLAQRVREACE